MWELDYEESWVPKNWCFWTVVLEKTLESPLDCKEIQPVHPKGDQSCVFIWGTDVEAETSILWPPYMKNWLIGKDPDAERDWGQEEKGMAEDEMVGWHHQLNGQGFGSTLGVGDGQGGLACCDSWAHKQLDMTERLNWTELNDIKNYISMEPAHLKRDAIIECWWKTTFGNSKAIGSLLTVLLFFSQSLEAGSNLIYAQCHSMQWRECHTDNHWIWSIVGAEESFPEMDLEIEWGHTN